MDWQNIISVNVANGSAVSLKFGPLAAGLFIIWLIIFSIRKNRWRELLNQWRVEKANIKLGGVGEVSIKPNVEDMQIAHKAWVELSTRKAGLLFDEEYDVIIEIYDSWYQLFSEVRSLAKEIPADKIRLSEDTQKLVQLLVDALNEGLRSHLTKWQAKFRRWYVKKAKKHPNKTPQEIQRLYPEYKELVKDLKRVNKQLVEYAAFIRRIAHG